MTNPTFPWQLVQLDPDTDAPKLMQDLEALTEWMQFESVHRHHITHTSFSVTTLAAGAVQDQNGITWPTPFASNVVPIVQLSINTTVAGKPGQADKLGYFASNISNTGCDVRVTNNGVSALGAGVIVVVSAFDSTYDTST